ncbi:NVEALA domain-containing protein [Marinifilum caeruleilacunae]|uniref:NVEALA family protein n=1 Tax=Marinifilum caeruleilacunae TaxID=2499076 RepID=A0ABX1X1L9_9BACT|nr:NVEALA domain-containing protein [Marinifilum caeruleilacunae]NOU62026.1 hypothetical protein [Marinifilum caeruleilacunae]
MKKKIFLSVIGLACFSFLFTYNANQTESGLVIDNIDALAQSRVITDDDGGFLCCNSIVNCCDYGDFEIDGEFVD